MKNEIICTVCPRGCIVTIETEDKNILKTEGYSCKRGLEYAEAEIVNPVRILTTTVRVDGNINELLPVRSEKPIPKDKLIECMEAIKKTSVTLPVKQYDIIINDILNTGINIVATKDLD